MDISRFNGFFYMPAILDLLDAYLNHPRRGYLEVFIVLQSLVGIDAVVSIICNFYILRVWLENAHSRPKIGIKKNPQLKQIVVLVRAVAKLCVSTM